MNMVPRLDVYSPANVRLLNRLVTDCGKAVVALTPGLNDLIDQTATEYGRIALHPRAGIGTTSARRTLALGGTTTTAKVTGPGAPNHAQAVADLEQRRERLREELAIVEEELAVLTCEPVKHDF